MAAADSIDPFTEPVPNTGLRFALRALAAFRFLPPMSWAFGSSTLFRHRGLSYRLYPARNHQDRALCITEAFDEHRSMARLGRLVSGRQVLILDIGANVGIYSTYLARMAGAGSRVILFEPNPVVAARLSENIKLNDQTDTIAVEQVALGAGEADVELSIPWTNFGGASLHRLDERSGVHKVRQQPLSNYLSRRASDDQFTLLKIDVEGNEDRVLCPMFDTVPVAEWPEAVLLEVSSAAKWDRDPVKALQDAGYREVFFAERNKLFLAPDMSGPS